MKYPILKTIRRSDFSEFFCNWIRKKIFMVFLNITLASSVLVPCGAHAIVAGGMASIYRTWPQVSGGYTDMEFFITVTKAPGFNGRTYWAHQWSYTGTRDGGYVGLQSRSGNDKALNFSIWGATGWRAATGANCSHFGHEGSGVQCWIKFSWEEGVTYRIKVAKSGTDGWTASIKNPRTGQVTTVATIVVPSNYGGLKGLVEWVENFAQGNEQYSACSKIPEAIAVYGVPRANGGTITPTSSSSNTYGNCASIAKAICTTEQVCTLSANPGPPFVRKHLQNSANLYCLDMLGGGLQAGLWECLGDNANQILTQDDNYRLRLSSNTGLCLAADANKRVITANCNNSAQQQWLKVNRTQAYFNAGTGLCMDSTDNGNLNASIRVHPCLENNFQRWRSLIPD
ncbi:MAG: hypothetical protein QOC89_3573 [Paraburkholderia sp.]|jgi:hypothetical protein|uniref:RICIN domain-containing protein n=1 Tax=Paraburkholderia sp. TaxID=1926495 RepID=UPI002AFF4EDD|nr:ricin-type beta-trefoil lectin domain protein [Paraburkholderia sp.]MEA3085876.1 hypothetical protein [Paraburkholderia sp.]